MSIRATHFLPIILAINTILCAWCEPVWAQQTPDQGSNGLAIMVQRTSPSTTRIAVFTTTGQVMRDGAERGDAVSATPNTIVSYQNFNYRLHSGTALFASSNTDTNIQVGKATIALPKQSKVQVSRQPGKTIAISNINGCTGLHLLLGTSTQIELPAGQQLQFDEASMQVTYVSKQEGADTEQLISCVTSSRPAQEPARLFCQPGSIWFSEDGTINLLYGRMLACAQTPLRVRTPMVTCISSPNSSLGVESWKDTSKVFSLSATEKVQLTTTAGETGSVRCGEELVISRQPLTTSEILPPDGIGRRLVKLVASKSALHFASSEFSIASFLMYSPAAREMRKSHDHFASLVLSHMMKTHAAMQIATHAHGGYTWAPVKSTSPDTSIANK